MRYPEMCIRDRVSSVTEIALCACVVDVLGIGALSVCVNCDLVNLHFQLLLDSVINII